MRLFLITLFLIFSIQEVSSKETESQIKTDQKDKKETSRTPNTQNLTEEEAQFRDTLLEIKSQLSKLPNICLSNKSLYEKAIEFQKKMDQIKILSLSAREMIFTHKIHFKRPVRQVFSINTFYSFIYEDSGLDYRKPLSKNEKILQQQLQDLSFVFQHSYKFNFNQPEDLPIQEYAEMVRDIALTLDCLSKIKINNNAS